MVHGLVRFKLLRLYYWGQFRLENADKDHIYPHDARRHVQGFSGGVSGDVPPRPILNAIVSERKCLWTLLITTAWYREDVRDLIGLTVNKMDNYMVINVLLLAFPLIMFTEGRPLTPRTN